MYYIWLPPRNYKNKEMGVYNRALSPDRFLLYAGRKLEKDVFPSPVVDFEISKDRARRFDCLSCSALVPLVNDKIKQLIELIAPDDVQFIPARLMCSDGELDGYFFINTLNRVKGLDHEKSELKKMDGVIYWYSRLVYKPDFMGKHLFIRDDSLSTFLFVNQQIKTIFEKEKIKGITFIEAIGYPGNY